MKILFLTDNFPPELNAPASRTFEHCVEWVKIGVDVTVITCFPNFPNGKIYSGYRNEFYKKEIINGIEVIRVWSYMAENSGFFKRSIDYLSFAITSFIFGVFIKFDIIIGTSPQFFSVVSAWALAKIKRKKWVFEVRDLWPESINAVGLMSKKSLIYRILKFIEIKLYRSSDYIVVVTDSFKSYMERYEINSKKIVVVKNGVNAVRFASIDKDQSLLRKLKLENKFIISYTGTIGLAHSLDFILDCASIIKDDSIHFIFQGDGAVKQNLINKAKKLRLKNVTFLNPVGRENVVKYLSISDVALVNLKKNQTFESVIPSKIFENVAMKKPILLGLQGESKKLIESYKVGLSFIPQNNNSFIKTLSKIKNFKNENFERNCEKMIDDFDRKKMAKKLLKFISK